MLYKVTGKFRGQKICDCPYCDGHLWESHIFERLVVVTSHQEPDTIALAEEATKLGYHDWEYIESPIIERIEGDQEMRHTPEAIALPGFEDLSPPGGIP